MMYSKYLKITFYLTLSIAPIILTYYLKNRYTKLIFEYTTKDTNDCQLIFTDFRNHVCKFHFYKRIPCSETCSYYYLTIIIKFMENAKQSISMCMCLATCFEIQDALIRAHNRGIIVRFISDTEMLGNTSARASVLQKSGIPIKIQHCSSSLLHHKFCLIDEKSPENANMFFGSMNLTCQALTSNFDIIIFTNNLNIVTRFHNEFEYLWNDFNYLQIK